MTAQQLGDDAAITTLTAREGAIVEARNSAIAHNAAAVSRGLASLPLDELPALASITVYPDADILDRAIVQAQLSSGRNNEPETDVAELVAWRDVLDHGEFTAHQAPGHTRVTATGELGGVNVEVWTHVNLDRAERIRLGAAGLTAAQRGDILLEAYGAGAFADVRTSGDADVRRS